MSEHPSLTSGINLAVATPYVLSETYDEETMETTTEVGWEWNFCPDCGREGAHESNSGRGGIRCG